MNKQEIDACKCTCHSNKLNKPYEHDTKCCENMNGSVEPQEWEKEFDEKFDGLYDLGIPDMDNPSAGSEIFHYNELKSFIKSLIEKTRAEATRCDKTVEEGKATCGVKLDCHLHDWRQKEAIEDLKKQIENELMRGKLRDEFETIFEKTNQETPEVPSTTNRSGAMLYLADVLNFIRKL